MGDGKSIDMRNDRWLATSELARVNEPSSMVKISECFNDSKTGWNLQKLGQVFHHESAMAAIKTPISLVQGMTPCGGLTLLMVATQ